MHRHPLAQQDRPHPLQPYLGVFLRIPAVKVVRLTLRVGGRLPAHWGLRMRWRIFIRGVVAVSVQLPAPFIIQRIDQQLPPRPL